MGFIKRHWIIFTSVGVVGLAVALFLLFGVFKIQTLWIDKKVDEANPFAVSTQQNDVALEDQPVVTLANSESPRTQFVRRSHPARGDVFLLTDGDKTFLRFENFATDNGPGLRVYLSNVPDGVNSSAGTFDDDFLDLGGLKGNIGDQNYEIPEGTDLSRFNTVAVWCDPFNVVFGAAPMPSF